MQLAAVGAGRGQPCHPEVVSEDPGTEAGSEDQALGIKQAGHIHHHVRLEKTSICLQKLEPHWLSNTEFEQQQPPPPPDDNVAQSRSTHVT